MCNSVGIYCVYCHLFPNGKKYIGISKEPQKRWGHNGEHYKSQKKVARAIKKYGWENVEHIILADGLTKEQAEAEEMRLIAENDSINNGYNVSIGGKGGNGTYLKPYVLAMINSAERYWPGIDGIWAIAKNERFNLEAAGYWNEADRAIEIKRGRKLSYSDMMDVSEYWSQQTDYFKLYNVMCELEEIVKNVGVTMS